MRCPDCKRTTRPRTRGRGGMDENGNEYPPGTIQAARADGMCFACYTATAGPRRDGVRQREYRRYQKPSFGEQEIQRANHAYQCFTARRRTRGVPSEGLPTETLQRPGLFLIEVP